jgi:Flp pilus assembly protein TadD
MRATTHPIRRLAYGIFLLALPLILSNCASHQTSAVRGLTPAEMSTLQALHDYMPHPQESHLHEKIPDERLEILGNMALENRNFQSSLVSYLHVLKDHPKRYDLHYKVGVIFLMTGNLQAAQKELALVLVHRPKMLKAHEALGVVFLEEKQYTQAIDEFQYVLTQDPQRASTHHLLGVAYLESDRPARAVYELRKATILAPRHLSSFITLALAYMKQKNYSQATATLKRAQALAPKNKKINRLLGEALASQKKYPQALAAFMKAGDEAQAYNNIGVYYFMDGQYEEAARCFQHALEIRPVFYQEAKKNLQRALEKLQESRQNGT